MTNYSIVRIGHEYVVQVDHKSVLKIASRRRAAKLVTAAELLESQPAAPPPRGAHAGSSSAGNPGGNTDPAEVP